MPSKNYSVSGSLSDETIAAQAGFYENSLFSVIVFSPELKVAAFNKRAAVRFLSQLNKEIKIGVDLFQLIPPQLLHDAKDDIESVFRGKEVNRITFVEDKIHPGWIKYCFSPVWDETAKQITYICLNIFEFENAPLDLKEKEYSILLFRKIFEFSTDASIILEIQEDHRTKFIDCNTRALELLGFNNLTEFEDHWDLFNLTPYNSNQVSFLFSELKANGRYKDEFRLNPFRGDPIFVSFRIYQFNYGGKTYNIVSISDINSLKTHEEKIKQQDKIFTFISKATKDGLYNYDLANNRIWVSDEYLKMVGNSDEVQDHHIEWFINRVHPDDRPNVERNLKGLMEGDVNNMRLEYRFLHQNGNYLFLIDRGFIIRDSDANVSQIIGAMTDVTELRVQEQRLIESEKKLLNILNTIKETVFSFTYQSRKKPRFNFFSQGDLSNWGYPEEKLTGPDQFWYEKVLEEDKINIVIPALKKLKKLRFAEIEYRFEKPGGEIIWISSRLSPQQISDSETLIIGTAIDITEKKQIERIIITQNEELKKANMELDRFVYSTSHDLRAPLTSVMGLINIFSMESCSPEQQQYLEMMKTSISRLDNFISNIVDYSRNSRTKIEFEKVNLREMIEESIDQLKFMDPDKTVIQEFDISKDVVLVTDKTRLQMIFNNLISNSIKYRKRDKTPCIIVFTAHKNIEKGSVMIQISDNGIGIPDKNLENIFDMFYTGGAENHGSGIGLYIVKESVEKLKGIIAVKSVLMQGTTFIIELPETLN